MAMPEKDPLITIVMLAYNEGRYLRHSMPAVFEQTFADFEVFVMNNGSTDDTLEVLAGFDDPRMKVFTNENIGLGLAYNVGISHARGKWIAIGNADDLWYPRKLEKQVEATKNDRVGVIFTEAELIDDNRNPVPREVAARFPFSFENLPPARLYEKFFFNTNFMCAPSAMIRKDLVDARPFDPMSLQLQDFELWVNLVQKAEFTTVPEKLIGYRVRLDGSNVSLNSSNRSRVLMELNIVYRRFFDGVDMEFFREAFRAHLRNPDFRDELAMEFEKAFLYLKMGEPAIRGIGMERLYELMSSSEGRNLAAREYNLKMPDIWTMALSPVYADASALDESSKNYLDTLEQLKATQAELAGIKETMRQITSGKLWKLREKVYDILKKPVRS